MIEKPEELRAFTHGLTLSVWSLSAIGVLFESGLAEHLREPRSAQDVAAKCPGMSQERIERILSVVATCGLVVADGHRYQLAPGGLPFLQPAMRAALLGDIRSHLMQPLAFLDSARDPAPQKGWRHTDPVLLQAQGDASGALGPMFKMGILPTLGELGARLESPGARFLDVGVGVGALAISMCRAFPQMSAVGIDPYEVSLALAQENVARAGLADRIELRRMGAEDLRDEGAFDLAWLPSFFVPSSALAGCVARVRAALRPGGCLLFAAGQSGGDERQRAVSAMVHEIWGGAGLGATEAQAMLVEAGFTSVRAAPGPAWAPAMILAQA
jgi:SAM-dependent methyltransferase